MRKRRRAVMGRSRFNPFAIMRGTSNAESERSLQERPRSPSPMSADFRPTRYSKWNPAGAASHAAGPDIHREEPKPTRTQSAVEITLFIVFGVLIVLAAVALYTS